MKKLFEHPKTTIAGIGVIAASLLPLFGVPAAICVAIGSAIGGLGLIVGADAKDTQEVK